MSGKIYSYSGNWRVKRVEAVAAFSGYKVEEVITEMSKVKEDDFLSKFPFGVVPAFESDDGVRIGEASAISQFVAKNGPTPFWPQDKKEEALIQMYLSIVDEEVAARLQVANGMTGGGYIPYSKPTFQWIVDRAMARLQSFNTVLQTQTFLVGERISVADIALASAMYSAFQHQVDAAMRAKIPNVVRHFETVTKNSKLASIFPEVQYIETAVTTPPKAEKPKAEKPKAEAAAAAPKAPKAKKAAEKDDDDEEPLVPAEPKAKNPLDDLPKSEFKLDDWKRSYSNEETKDALAWFYKNFDAEGYSIWRVDFKYNDELTQVFMSSNLIGGFFNRLEASRKYAMGSMGVFGKANDSVISGAFVVRGKDYKPVMDVAPDWESYSYTPLDLSKAEDKKFFEEAMEWSGEVEGKAFADGKIFK